MSQSAPSLTEATLHSDAHGEKGLQHHFTTFEQQIDATKIGMWVFLGTELLMFGGLFVGFAMMQAAHPDAFYAAHHHLDKRLGFLNTVVLLVSSWTMVMGVWAAKHNKQKAMIRYLVATLGLAGVFLVVKFFEYSHKFHDGLLPGRFYNHFGDAVPGQQMFFGFYFVMTGLHGIHVLAGMAAILWLVIRAKRGDFTADYWGPVDITGLYWHLVDMVWIYLFPLLYLIS
jgi:cytochrome c oxidase subunit III